MSVLGRWGSHGVELALALLLALLLMQLPAFTADYAATLEQIAAATRRDIDLREASARRHYAIDAATEAGLIDSLRAYEPSNAETLALALERLAALEGAAGRIRSSGLLFEPLTALVAAGDDPEGYQAPIWRMLLRDYRIRLDLTEVALVYGGVGLVLGPLLAQLLLLPFRRLFGHRAAHRS